jgi:hypothetical protein
MLRDFVRSVLIFAAVGLAVACSAPVPTPTPAPPTATATAVPSTPTSLPSPTATSIPPTPTAVLSPTRGPSPTPGPKENLLAAYNTALSKIKAYRVKVILNPSRQDDPERIIEVILPDRFRQIQGSDVRQIGNRVYVQEPIQYSGTIANLLPQFERVSLPAYRDQISKASQASFIGRSVIDNVQVVGYQTTVKTVGMNASFPDTFGKISEEPMKIWFSAADGFPVRMEIGQPVNYIAIYYDFNGKIDQIGPP